MADLVVVQGQEPRTNELLPTESPMIRHLLLFAAMTTLLILTAVPGLRPLSAAESAPATLPLSLSIQPLLAAHTGKTGLHVLEKGEESLLARAWLADHATKTSAAKRNRLHLWKALPPEPIP